jgi:uncharacterized membrane protein
MAVEVRNDGGFWCQRRRRLTEGLDVVRRRGSKGALMTVSVREARLAGLFLLLSIGTALAQPGFVYSLDSKSFTALDPGHAAIGINDFGQIVGSTPTDGSLPAHGFVREANAVVTFLDFPHAYYTSFNAINNAGQIVGNQCGGPAPLICTGFLKDGATFTPFGYPGAIYTFANGINNTGQVVGAYRVEVVSGSTVQDFDHALFIEGNTRTPFDFPGAHSTVFLGLNNATEIVGYYVELINTWPGFRYRGLVKKGNVATSVDFPNALFTIAAGINDSGQIVGDYTDRYGYRHGFVKTGSAFASFDFFGADTIPETINNNGQIVGNYYARPVLSTITEFTSDIKGLGLPDGATSSLVAKLKNVLNAFDAGDKIMACGQTDAFTKYVQAQSGKKLTRSQANFLLGISSQTDALLGCQ